MQNPGQTWIFYKPGQTRLTWTKSDPVDLDNTTWFQLCSRHSDAAGAVYHKQHPIHVGGEGQIYQGRYPLKKLKKNAMLPKQMKTLQWEMEEYLKRISWGWHHTGSSLAATRLKEATPTPVEQYHNDRERPTKGPLNIIFSQSFFINSNITTMSLPSTATNS